MPASTSEHPTPATRRVLLLLCAQLALLNPSPTSVPAAPPTRANLHRILTLARAATPPPLIIHVRNTGAPGEPDAPHAPGWPLALPPLPHEPVVDKPTTNAFAGTRLPALVPPDAELVVVGLLSDFCVRATCRAALRRGNDVILIRGAHAAFDRIEVSYGGGMTAASEVEAEVEAELEEAGVVLLDMKDVPGIFTDR